MAVQFDSNEQAVERMRELERDYEAAIERKARAEKEFLAAAAKVRRVRNEQDRVVDWLSEHFDMGVEQ